MNETHGPLSSADVTPSKGDLSKDAYKDSSADICSGLDLLSRFQV